MYPASLPRNTSVIPSWALQAVTGELTLAAPVFAIHRTPSRAALLVEMDGSADTLVLPASLPMRLQV
jgi:hypothetical protein